MNFAYQIGETAFLITDTEQKQRIVTGIQIRKGSITYALSCGVDETWHYDYEISSCKDILKELSIENSNL